MRALLVATLLLASVAGCAILAPQATEAIVQPSSWDRFFVGLGADIEGVIVHVGKVLRWILLP